MMLQLLVSLLIYPGLILALGLALLFGWLLEGRVNLAWLRGADWLSFDGLASLASVALIALALALLPWPWHPAAGWALIGNPIAVWAALEGAFLLALLPALLAVSPLGARAASREAQMGVAGRCVIWLALGIALWGGAGWTLALLPGRLLVALAGLLALPAAIGAGPFGAERSLNATGAEEGLDEATTGLVRFARHTRSAGLLAALLVGVLPLAAGGWSAAFAPGLAARTQPWIVVLLLAALFVLATLGLRQSARRLPRLTLPAALRWCWWRVLPIALVGLIYLTIV